MQRLIGEGKWCRHLQEVGKVRREPKGSLAPFQRVSKWLDLEKLFTWSSTGSLQGFYKMFYRMFYRNKPKVIFEGLEEEKWWEKRKWRLDEGVIGSRTLLMKIKHEGAGWIGSKDKKAILHKNVEIRVSWESVANGGKKSWVRGWNTLHDGGRVGRDVLQVFCTLLSKTDQTKTMQTKDLAILA